MTILGTSILYALLGVVFAVALVLREPSPSAGRVASLLCLGVVFWPLFAPALFSDGRGVGASARPGGSAASEFAPQIRAAETGLLSALARVKGGAAAEAVAPEAARIRELVGGLASMAARLGEIDDALRMPELDEAAARGALEAEVARGSGAGDPRVASVQARLRNIERLRGLRERTREDLERALLKVDEISSQMLLLKFAGRPEAEVADLINAIAEGVEGATEAMMALA